MTNEVPKKPWTYLIVDLITKLLLLLEKNVILVVYDRLSKMIYFVATTEGISAESLVSVMINASWSQHGHG